MWKLLLILIPLLFVIGMAYSALKEQKKMEQELLPKILQKRKEEEERLLKLYRSTGDKQALAKLERLRGGGDDEEDR